MYNKTDLWCVYEHELLCDLFGFQPESYVCVGTRCATVMLEVELCTTHLPWSLLCTNMSCGVIFSCFIPNHILYRNNVQV